MVTQLTTRQVDVRGRTITTAIVAAAMPELAATAVGDEVELLLEPFPAVVPDLEAWSRAVGHELVEVVDDVGFRRVRIRKGAPRRNDRRVAVVVSSDGLLELLSPVAFALAAAQAGSNVAMYLQGPGVHVLAPGFRPALRGLSRPFSRFARAGLEKIGHVPVAEKLQQIQELGGVLYACGPSLVRFKVGRLAFDDVVVCEYLTFMEVMQRSEVQLYA